MAVAGTLEIQLLANIARLQSDMTSAKGAVGSAMKSIESSVALAKSALGALGIGLGVGYFTSLIKGTIDAADKINDLSQSTGIAVVELGKYKLATEQSGTTLEGLARGVKGLATAFAEHGTELKAAGINATTTDGRMRQLADIFSKMPDGMEKTTLAVKLFGKAGMDLIPMLNMGSKGLAETAEKSAQYAAVLATLAPQADRFNDTMAELGMASKVASLSLVNDALPAMTKIAAAMAVAAHESGMLKAAWVGFGGIAWEGIFKPLIALIKGTTANLFELNAGLMKFFGQNAAAASEYQKAARVWKEIGAMEEPPDAHKPEKVFDSDKWVAQYKKMLAALGVEGKKVKAPAGMSFDELLARNAQAREKFIQEQEDAANAVGQVWVDADKAARQAMWEGKAEALAADIEAAQNVAAQIGQIDLKRINDRTKAEIDAAKKVADYRKDQEKEITRGLTDALMRGFEGGEGVAKTFWKTMVNMAKTIVLRPIIEGVMSPVSSAVGSGITSGLTGIGISGLAGYASAGVPVTSTVGAVASGAGYAGAGSTGLMGTAGSALAAMGPVGWIALAAVAAYAIWSSNQKEEIKNPWASINTSGAGGPAGQLAITQMDLAGGDDPQQWANINAWLDQLPDKVKTAVDGLGMVFEPGTTSGQAWSAFEAAIGTTAGSLNLTTEEMRHLWPIAERVAYETKLVSDRHEMEIKLLEATGDASGALAIRRADELAAMDESLRPLQEQINAANDLAVASAAAAQAQQEAADVAAELARTNQGWQDQLDVLTGARTQQQVDRANTLAAATDSTTKALIEQVFAQQDLLAGIKEVVAEIEASPLFPARHGGVLPGQAIIDERKKLQEELDKLRMTETELYNKQRNAIWASNRALWDQIQALKAAAEAAEKAAEIAKEQRSLDIQLLDALGKSEEALAATRADQLAAMDASLRGTQQAIWDALDATKLREATKQWTDTLESWLSGNILSDSLSPLTAEQKLKEARQQYELAKEGSDASALTQAANTLLAADKAVEGFGGGYSVLFSRIRADISGMAGRGSVENVNVQINDNVVQLRTSTEDMKVVLARLLERLNNSYDEQTAQLINTIIDGFNRQANATIQATQLQARA